LSIRNKIFIFCLAIFFLLQCRFDFINQPHSASPGEIINIAIRISDDFVPEPNAHKGLLGVLLPEDWSFVSADYSGDIGSGILDISEAWQDSIEHCYPAESFAAGMRWIALLSDSGFAYQDPIQVDISLRLQVGQQEGCYDLGYLVTKATPNLLCTSWTPLSYPHRIGVPDSCSGSELRKAESAPQWNDLFNRSSGWTGADGIYSIPLSGKEYPGQAAESKTLLLFSDTFIGEVDETGKRSNASLVNNTYAIMEGSQPQQENIDFFWKTDNGEAATLFVPDTPTSIANNWYWLMDGVAVGDSIHVFALRLKPGGGFGFELDGVNLLSFTLDNEQEIRSYRQVDTPLFYKNDRAGYEIVLGQAVMPMTYVTGNPSTDGYIYIYGPKNFPGKKDLVAARVLPEYISDFSMYEYWDGQDWSSDVLNLASITSFISQEFSVSPLDDGSFLATFMLNNQVAVRKGQSPVGPFNIFQTIWDCPEVLEDSDIFVYNAKAHPHLSNPGELLISYNVNTFDFWDHFSNAGIYRPRFVTLSLSEFGYKAFTADKKVTLFPNWPNPLTAETSVKYIVRRDAHVDLAVYDILGQKVKTLHKGFQTADLYTSKWDGRNNFGQNVSSGIYILNMRAAGSSVSHKMILIR